MRLIAVDEIVASGADNGASLDAALVQKAYEYASIKHNGQKRKSGDPYFKHPASVAQIIARMELDTDSVCAALLHDVVEDCDDVDTADIESRFGKEVAFLVDGVTKLGRLNFTSKEDRQAESFRKMLLAMARDIRVILVKLADRLDNMRTLEHMSSQAQERIARETLEIYAPIADRLGIEWMKAELEDLSFRYLYPEPYRELLEKLEETQDATDAYVEEVCSSLKKMLITRGFAGNVHGRRKNLFSIYQKMRRHDYSFDQIQDLLAFRVVTESVSDCYAALGIVHSEWTPVPGRFKDYIALPKANLYQSLHTTVIGPRTRRIELQIRTHEMHKIAEQGIAAHWQYKQGGKGKFTSDDAERFAWLRELLEYQRDVDDPAEFYETVRVDLYPEDVYVFTPRGDVKALPRNACTLDFAFAVHSEVGLHCVGARVNGSMVPIRHKLHNGDVVEIITKKNQQPGKDWLDFVVTSRARSRIRQYLRTEERARSVELGKELLDRAMRAQGLSTTKFLKSRDFEKLYRHFRLKTDEEFFAELAYGKITTDAVMEQIVPPDSKAQARKHEESFVERTVRRVRKNSGAIKIDGLDNVLVRFGNCCQPVHGEEVVGWITTGRGVSVHRRGCANMMDLDPARRVDVAWGEPEGVTLPVILRVATSDKPGILSRVSAVFNENGINISEARCRAAENGHAENLFHFSVGGVKPLSRLMKNISKIDGVREVVRIGGKSEQ